LSATSVYIVTLPLQLPYLVRYPVLEKESVTGFDSFKNAHDRIPRSFSIIIIIISMLFTVQKVE